VRADEAERGLRTSARDPPQAACHFDGQAGAAGVFHGSDFGQLGDRRSRRHGSPSRVAAEADRDGEGLPPRSESTDRKLGQPAACPRRMPVSSPLRPCESTAAFPTHLLGNVNGPFSQLLDAAISQVSRAFWQADCVTSYGFQPTVGESRVGKVVVPRLLDGPICTYRNRRLS
jgi:hypothetical protein